MQQLDTKFKPGDTAYFMRTNKVKQGIIVSVTIAAMRDTNAAQISFYDNPNDKQQTHLSLPFSSLFAEKKQLLETL